MNDCCDSHSAAHPVDTAAWEDPPRGGADMAPVLTVEGFEGPLDWWLEMARGQKIDLAKLSIASLIGGFATAMEAALGRRLDGQLAHWAVWTVMAATLTELWSRLLLPPDAPAARTAVEEAEALRRQLLDRARMRAAAEWLERRTQLGRDAFRRGQPEGTVPAAAATSPNYCVRVWWRWRCRRIRRSRCAPDRRRCGLRAMPCGSCCVCCLNCPMAVR